MAQLLSDKCGYQLEPSLCSFQLFAMLTSPWVKDFNFRNKRFQLSEVTQCIKSQQMVARAGYCGYASGDLNLGY